MAEFVFDSRVIDVVGVTAQGDVGLYIVQPEPWTGSDEQLLSLQEKIHTYVGYACDGLMHRQHPETRGLNWKIVIHSQSGPPDARTAILVNDTREPVRRYGGDLEMVETIT